MSIVVTWHGGALAISAPHPEPPVNIRLESGDIVVELEGDIEVALNVDRVPNGTFR